MHSGTDVPGGVIDSAANMTLQMNHLVLATSTKQQGDDVKEREEFDADIDRLQDDLREHTRVVKEAEAHLKEQQRLLDLAEAESKAAEEKYLALKQWGEERVGHDRRKRRRLE